MRLHIIGTVRNKLNIKSIIGYYVWDVESNNMKLVGTKDLKRAILEANVSFSNVDLTENSEYGKIIGSHYSLDKLTHIQDGTDNSNILSKYTVMDSYADNTFLIARFDGTNIDYKLCSVEQMYFMADSIWNYDLKSDILYPKNRKVRSCDLGCKLTIDQESHNKAVKQLEKINSKSNNRKEILLEQAYNKDTVWSIEEFKEFMGLMGWSYTMNRVYPCSNLTEDLYKETKHCDYFYALNDVDENCEVLHMPIGVCKSKNLFRRRPKNIHTLIISSTVQEIENLYIINTKPSTTNDVQNLFGNGVIANIMCGVMGDYNIEYERRKEIREMQIELITVHNIYRQTCSEKLLQSLRYNKYNFNGLCMLNITGELELNIKEIRLFKAFNLCTFNEIPYIECKKLGCCFRNIRANNNRVEINVKTLSESFVDVKLKENTIVVLGENTALISESFIKCILGNIDISQAINIEQISSSFCHISDLEVIDMSNIQVKLDRLVASFSNCDKLHSIILPKSIQTIGRTNAEGSKLIKEVIIPEDVDCIYNECFLGDTCRVIYPKKITNLTREYMIGFRNAKRYEPVFQSTIASLNTTLPETYGKLSDLKLPNTIQSMPKGVFRSTSLIDYDSRLLPYVTHIPDEAFRDSSIKHVIFADNITTIGKDALTTCDRLRSVILGKNIEQMPNTLLKDCKPSVLIKVYVVKNSYASKRLRKNNKMVMIEVDNTEEAIEREYGSTTPEVKQPKFEMMLHGTKYEALLNKHCISNISYLYPLFKALANDEEYLQNKIELDTRKFKSMPIEYLYNLDVRLKYLRDNVSLGDKNNIKRFISICNLVTTLTNNCDELFDKANINSISIVFSDILAYIDDDNAILFTKFSKDNKTVTLLCIVYNNKVVYLTPFWSSRYTSIFKLSPRLSLFTSVINIDRSVNYANMGLGTILVEGDRLGNRYSTPPDSCVHGFTIPNNYVNIVDDNIRNTSRMIGILNFERKSKQKKQYEVNYDILLYECLNAKFIECVANIDFSDEDNTEVGRVNIISIKHTYDLSDIDKIDKEYFEYLTEGFNSRLSHNIIKDMTLSDEDKQQIKSDMANYDLDGDMNITYIGELVYQNGIDTVEKLLQNKSIIQRILDSHLYTKANISMNFLKKNSNAYNNILMKSVLNSGSILMEYQAKLDNGYDIYITGLADGSTTMSSKKFLNGGYLRLDRVLLLLNTIGNYRELYKGEHEPRIDNRAIDVNNFYFVLSKTLSQFYKYGMKIHLAIDLYNADTYILGDLWNSNFYKLFRIKEYQQGLKLFNTLIYEKYHNSLITMINCISLGKLCRPADSLQKLREDIMNGLPNNIPYTGNMISFAEIMAKQPL